MLVLAAMVVTFVAAPVWRRGPTRPAGPSAEAADDRAALEAAKEAKYREIRDAELDYRTGKLAREDWEQLDAALRAEAVEILRRLEGPAADAEPGRTTG